MISKNYWPTASRAVKNSIDNWVKSNQQRINVSDSQQQFDLVSKLTFDIKNRIYSIDKVLSRGGCTNYGQVGYSNLMDHKDKFIMLNESKQSLLSNLPPCKTVMVEIPKADGSRRLLGLSMPIDKVLQQMFLNFLDVLVEKQLHANLFAYRKGRDARSCVATAYSKLNQSLYLEDISIASVNIDNCFDNILHNSILDYYPFPIKYQWLLRRWLRTRIMLVKKGQVQNMGILERGIPQGSILGPSVTNVILSKTLPPRVFKTVKKDQKYIWVENYSYADDILIIGNRSKEFNKYIHKVKLSLSMVGLSINLKKTKLYPKVKSKVNFYFLGFEFIIIPHTLLRKTKLFTNLNSLNRQKVSQNGFATILKPKSERVREVKKELKQAIYRIHRVSKAQLFKIFQLINRILLTWGQYFYFNQGCVYGRMLDQYVCIHLRKALVKKFRYNGLLRPKWVAYNFIGLTKNNPNNKAWQFRSLKYISKTKTRSYEYLWLLRDTFSKLSITTFLINPKIRSLSYYDNPSMFDDIMRTNKSKRLRSNLMFRTFEEQNDLCLVCKESRTDKSLLNRSLTAHLDHNVRWNLEKSLGITDKLTSQEKL